MLRNKGIRIEWNSPVMEMGNSEVIRVIMGMGWGGFDLAFGKLEVLNGFRLHRSIHLTSLTPHRSNTSQVGL
jgi:hypothetical protein